MTPQPSKFTLQLIESSVLFGAGLALAAIASRICLGSCLAQ